MAVGYFTPVEAHMVTKHLASVDHYTCFFSMFAVTFSISRCFLIFFVCFLTKSQTRRNWWCHRTNISGSGTFLVWMHQLVQKWVWEPESAYSSNSIAMWMERGKPTLLALPLCNLPTSQLCSHNYNNGGHQELYSAASIKSWVFLHHSLSSEEVCFVSGGSIVV